MITNDKRLFIDKISSILDYPDEEEEGIYVVEGNSKRWLKMKYIENETSTIGVIIDVTDEMIVKKKIIQDRDIDPLTGIYNRKAMQYNIENALSTRDKQLKAAILMLDLDNLKIINDTYGHKWGDIYIRQAVQHLAGISEDRMVLGRRSGDEFTILLYNFSTRNQIKSCIWDFYSKLKNDLLLFPDGMEKQVSISAGLVWIDDHEASFDEYLQMADDALYYTKRNEKGYCYEYSSMNYIRIQPERDL